MLGSLARKLRALGYDTAYYRSGSDVDLLSLATSSNRVILTSDRALAAGAPGRGAEAILVAGENDRERFRNLAGAVREKGLPMSRGPPLCSVCGGSLEKVAKSEVSGRVPPSVERRHRLFYRCFSCGKLYWRGGHWKRLRYLASILEAE